MRKTLTLLLFLISGSLPVFSQTTTPLSLPFFDDFSKFSRLDSTKWEKNTTVYINNHYSKNPVSKNVATFNGVDNKGRFNPVTTLQHSEVDTLTSLPINLAGKVASDSIYLSFFLQTGGVPKPPVYSSSKPTFVLVEFRNNSGNWNQVFQFDPPTSANRTLDFKQFFLALTDPQYLHNNFRFRFISYGNPSLSLTTYNLDYVYLNQGREKREDRIDVTTSRYVSPLLQRYTALPVHQFNANIAGELNDSVYTTLNNLENAFRSITAYTTIQIGNGSPTIINTKPIAIASFANQYRDFPGAPAASIFNGLSGFQKIKSTVSLQTNELNAETRYNDTISRVTDIRDYYAYDDGSAESLISVLPSTSSLVQLALRFDLNAPDQVTGFNFYLPKAYNTKNKQVTLKVWTADANGLPATSLFSLSYLVPDPAFLDTWINIPVNPPVQVSGSFFVGWSYPAAAPGTFATGLDLNNPKSFLVNNTNSWQTINEGVPMVRVFMSNHSLGTAEEKLNAPDVQIYPNPARDNITVKGAFDSLKLLTITGQVVLEKTGNSEAETQLPLNNLMPGLYLVQLQLKGRVQTQKLIIQPN